MTDLAESLVPTQIARNRFRFDQVPQGGGDGYVWAGHLLGTMTTACLRSQRSHLRSIRSIHAIFARVTKPDRPYELSIDALHEGRSFCSASASVWQGGIERARALVLLSAQEPDFLRHQAPAPEAGRPEESPLVPDVLGREIRVVGGTDVYDPDVVTQPTLSVWIRHAPAAIDLSMSQALLAHDTASFLIGTATLPHPGVSEASAHVLFSAGVLTHTVSFHSAFDPGEWLLITQASTHAGGGLAYGTGQVFTERGAMVASFSQDALLRGDSDERRLGGAGSGIL